MSNDIIGREVNTKTGQAPKPVPVCIPEEGPAVEDGLHHCAIAIERVAAKRVFV
jgi:hypothetical protein